jgi:hypothetical protein
LLANRTREVKLKRCRQLLSSPAPEPVPADEPEDYRDRYQRLTGVSLWDCPQCKRGRMICIETLLPAALPRGPPSLATWIIHYRSIGVPRDVPNAAERWPVRKLAWRREAPLTRLLLVEVVAHQVPVAALTRLARRHIAGPLLMHARVCGAFS